MSPRDQFLDTHWRALSQMLMDDAGLALRQALDFVPTAVEAIDARDAEADSAGGEGRCVEVVAQRIGCDVETARRGLGIVERALREPQPKRPAHPGRR